MCVCACVPRGHLYVHTYVHVHLYTCVNVIIMLHYIEKMPMCITNA